jgi:hypothetical protein
MYVFISFLFEIERKKVKHGITEHSAMETKNDGAWFNLKKHATITDRRRKKEKEQNG